MERMKYDADWIFAFAMALEQKAKNLIFNAWITAFLIGTLVVAVLLSRPEIANRSAVIFLSVVFSSILGFILAGRASNKAALLRLQAHTALCQVQIELNTRK